MSIYAENVFGAIDIIVQERMKDLKFDKTIVCSIVENLGEGIYTVSDGSSQFEAVSDIMSYAVGFQVNVLVPQGDFNNQKTITGRYISKDGDVNSVRYMTPFDNCLDVTGNIIVPQPDGKELLANGLDKEILCWEKDLSLQDTSGYEFIGLSADFFAALSAFSPTAGNYGLKMMLNAIEKNSDDKSRDYTYFLDSSDMYGNPYLFETYFNQQKIFNIEKFKKINSIKIYFYQNSNFEYEYEKDGVVIKEEVPTTTGEDIWKVDILPNLKVKNFYLFFGYALDKIESDTVILLTTDSEKYNHTEEVDSNKKDLYVKWVRREGSYAYVMEEDMLDPSIRIHWYRYDKTFKEDPIAGDNWEEISQGYSNLSFLDIPLRIDKKMEEKFKVIISRGEIDEITTLEEEVGLAERLETNEVEFSSSVPIADPDGADLLTGLKIVYVNDNYQGMYRIYGENKELKNRSEHLIQRTLALSLEVHKEPVEISEKDKIVWKVPKNATMIEHSETEETCELDRTSDLVYDIITKTGEDPELHYTIKEIYSETNVNNTILCELTRDGTGLTYKTSTTMTFGATGTAGTDYTFVIEPVNGNGIYTAESGETLTFAAKLYDYNDKPVDWSTETISWDWEIVGTDKKPPLHAFDWVDNKKIGAQISLKPNDVDGNGKPVSGYNKHRYYYNLLKATATVTTAYEVKTPKIDKDGNYIDINGDKIEQDTETGEIDLTNVDWETEIQSKQVSMSAYYSIPVRSHKDYYISGATSIFYNSSGVEPVYEKSEYLIFGVNGDINPEWRVVYEESDVAMSAYYPQIVPQYEDVQRQKLKGYFLSPKTMYIQDVPNRLAIECYYKNSKKEEVRLWVQPLIIRQSKHGSSLLNRWDGSLTIDEKNGTILSTMVGAGKKEADNTFSGVLMGDVVSTAGDNTLSKIGIYGFNHGEQSYAFMNDGTAFIGKSNRGRIIFDGNNGIIASQGYFSTKDNDRTIGMKLDLNTGKFLSSNTGGIVEIDPTDSKRVFRIKDKNATTIMLVGDTDYYLKSSNYDWKNTGTNFNLVNGNLNMANTGGWVSITPGDKSSLFAVRGKDYVRYDSSIADNKISTTSSKFKDDTEEKISDTKKEILSIYYESYAEDATQKKLETDTTYYYKITEVVKTIETGKDDKIETKKPYYEVYEENLKLTRPVLYTMGTKTLMNVGNTDYYLRSFNFSNDNWSGMNINLNDGTLLARGKGGYINIVPHSNKNLFNITYRNVDDNEVETKKTLMQVGGGSYYLQSANYTNTSGMKINLENGSIDAAGTDGKIKINPNSSSSIFTLEGKDSNGNFQTLMRVGNGSYYLQSANYSSSGKTGMNINLQNGSIDAANFKINSNGDASFTGNISASTISGGSININNGVFKVESDGKLTASSAEITGTINATGGTFSGNITASGTITGGTISGASISGGSISINGGEKFSVDSNGSLTASYGSIGGASFITYQTNLQEWGSVYFGTSTLKEIFGGYADKNHSHSGYLTSIPAHSHSGTFTDSMGAIIRITVS